MRKGIIAAIVAIAIGIVIVIVIVIIGVTSYQSGTSPTEQPAQTSNTQSGEQTKTPAQAHQGKPSTTQNPSKPNKKEQPTRTATDTEPAGSPAERYCVDNHDKADTSAITEAGGLVHIFQHEAALPDAYSCASAYLDQGGNVNAADPADGSKHLTPLLFAIKRNDPKMVHFMLDHGADPSKRGGPNDIKPYGYAVFQALHNRSTDYNAVIGILDSALENSSSGASH